MQFDFSLSAILQSIIVAVGLVALWLAWQWLRTWRASAAIGQQQSALDQLASYAQVFVRAAEQIYIANPTKLKYVLSQLGDIFPDVDEELVRAVVEAAVNEVKSGPRPDRPPQPVNCDDLAGNPTATASSPPAKVARSHTVSAAPPARP